MGVKRLERYTPFPRLLYPLLPVQSSAAPRGLGSANEQITLITSRVCAHFKEENSEAPKTQRHPDITDGQPGSDRLCSGRAAVCALSGPGLTPSPARQPRAPGLYSLESDRVEGCRGRKGRVLPYLSCSRRLSLVTTHLHGGFMERAPQASSKCIVCIITIHPSQTL